MKEHVFKCDSRAPRARMALDEHLHYNPNGLPLHNGKSRSKFYSGYRVYETKTQVVVKLI